MAKRSGIRIPLYLQLIVTYLLVLLIVFAILSPVLSRAIALSKHNYLIEAQHALDSSATVLHNTFREIYQLPPKLEDNGYYVRMKIAGDPLGTDAYTGMFMTNKLLAKQLVTLEYVDEIFLYLSNSGITFGKLRVFETLEDYLGFDLIYEDRPMEAVRDFIASGGQGGRIYPAARARVHRGAPQEYLMVTMTRPSDSVTVGAVLSQRNLLELFGMHNLPDSCFFYLTDPQDSLLYAYRYDGAPLPADATEATLGGEAYSVLTATTPLPAMRIQLGIPQSYFIAQQQPLIAMVRSIQWSAIVLGIVLSALFALLGALPVRKLLRGGPGSAARTSHIRELDAIGGYLHSSSQTIETLSADIAHMEDTLRASILLQMLYGTLSAAEQPLAATLVPQTAQPYRVAVFMRFGGDAMAGGTGVTDDAAVANAGAGDGGYAGYYMHRQIEVRLGGAGFALGQISPDKYAVLYADTPQNHQAIRQTHAALNAVEATGGGGAIGGIEPQGISCGISDALTGKKNVGIAYRHALLCLSADEAGSLRLYDGPQAGAQPVGPYDMQRLYDFISACDCPQADALLSRIHQSIRHGGQETVQVFYLIRSVLESAMRDGGLTGAELVLPDYVQAMTDRELLDTLRAHTHLLMDALAAKRAAGKARWQADLLAYIDAHFADPGLYAESIAEAFDISRNLVFKVVREHTGKSLSEYIEQLRMQRAMQLLKTTQETVADIAAQCGYNSTNTFYKVFKKNYGFSPSQVRGGPAG